ncbi:MAG TPA: MBG domain-containing protein, partial [Pyrinomonadaceae bacterium]
SNVATLTVNKAGSTTTVTCAAGSVYTGSPIEPCTYTVTGNEAGNPVLVAATAVPSGNYANNINAGVNTASASFTFTGDANHNGSSDSETFSIDKAGSTTTVTCAAGSVYTGSPIEPCTYTVTGNEAGNPVLVAATAVPSGNYTNNINAGVNTASASFTFAGDTNHNGSSDSETFSIDKANQTITWSNPAAIVYGTPLSATQLNATVAGVSGGSAPGALTYTPAAGTVLNAGNGQTLAVDAAATTNYNAAHKEVLINVNKAPLTITASSHTVVFNDAVPTITPSYLGFVNGDDSGDLTPPTCSTTYTVGSLVGTYPSKCENAVSGNYAFTYVDGTVTVNTACSVFNGFLPPIGGSVETLNGGSFASPVRAFKLNSTVPVKFSAMCFGQPLTTGIHTLMAIKYSNSTTSTDEAIAVSTDAATVGNQFRLTDGEWHFNMNTKGFGNNGQGTWLLQATLFDGSKHTVWVAIKK